MRSALIAMFILISSQSIFAKVVEPTIETQEIEYEANGLKLKGFIVEPKIHKKNTPGILVIHEWWGHNAYARHRAEMLAKLGYIAFALDMYGKDKIADNPKDAGHLMNEAIDSGQLEARFRAALDILKKNPQVDQNRLSAIGYCFGGGVVLRMARTEIPLRSVVSFHGSFPPHQNLEIGSVKVKSLILHGGEDKFASPTDIAVFKSDMDGAKADYKFIVYPKAKHGFTDPDNSMRGEMHHIPIGYNKEADDKSWKEMKKFLDVNFR